MPEYRDIIEIDEEKCNGCGQCILACAEGALKIVGGKAKLVGDLFCDGLGACLGECPEGALKIVQRQAEAFDEEAVEELLAEQKAAQAEPAPAGGCPGSRALPLAGGGDCPGSRAMPLGGGGQSPGAGVSTLGHWPIKLQLLSPQAPFLKDADLVLLADCAAVSYPNVHAELLPGKAVALACPKLDDAQAHIDKLATLLAGAKPRSITVVIMEVPCCKGLEIIVQRALDKAGLNIPVGRMLVARDGRVLERTPSEAARGPQA